ncbi:phosphoribosylformylglycinamidine synthase subunit PurS [Alicyclobacillus fastidiosus]|uniref:Phosphoribosylformylglycinamidine synthase subunit PurS n=1 Tax=Alicyclobacillus fastidiosus TaxID=392011 RepID=A0ABV5AFN8_9BACL|nr:phosphoribosylformylglycinamidine synthase subunit PurS [Alicyclobacillus fastidiosus]WEH09399.1 phosphoribosylformylglycinamidine synthase subunit PurS [Alicyclobacillus fastidiosus]
MKTYEVEVRIWLKPSVFDPQGHAVEQALHTLGYSEASDLRIGKYMHLTVQGESEQQAKTRVEEMCERVLSNPVMETYAYTLKEVALS